MTLDSLLFKLTTIVTPEYGPFQFISAGLYAFAGILGALCLRISRLAQMLMVALGVLMACDELLMIHECLSEATHSRNLFFAVYGLVTIYLIIHVWVNYQRALGGHFWFALFIGILVVGTEALDWSYIPDARTFEELGEALAPCLACIWILTLERSFKNGRILHVGLVSLAAGTLTTAVILGTRAQLCPKVDYWSHKFWKDQW